jgi:hypothetical protein
MPEIFGLTQITFIQAIAYSKLTISNSKEKVMKELQCVSSYWWPQLWRIHQLMPCPYSIEPVDDGLDGFDLLVPSTVDIYKLRRFIAGDCGEAAGFMRTIDQDMNKLPYDR